MTEYRVTLVCALLSCLAASALVIANTAIAEPRDMSHLVTQGSFSPDDFKPDPAYDPAGYDAEQQLVIYGGKFRVHNPRPIVEMGRPIYQGGIYEPPSAAFGQGNPTDHSLSLYGDIRTGLARNDNGGGAVSILAARANIDADLKLTGTERIHAFFRPFERNGQIAQCRSATIGFPSTCSSTISLKAAALFFEGDFGAISNGWSGSSSSFDLPFAVGKMRLQMQNGVWLDDALTGIAFTIPSRHSTALDVSNFDITVFAGLNDVTTPAIPDAAGAASSNNRVFGFATFAEASQGYWEFGIARVAPRGDTRSLAYNNLTGSFTRRYGGWLSNSVRIVHNAGQRSTGGANFPRANGTMLLIENSLVTRSQYTLVPYLNFFISHDSPQSVAKDADGGGILKNTGINFETDGLTGSPRLDDSGRNSYGGAAGIQYLFDLKRQLVVELASIRPQGGNAGNGTPAQVALGIRYQMALDQAWIFRSDLMVAHRQSQSDLKGIRFELRRKF